MLISIAAVIFVGVAFFAGAFIMSWAAGHGPVSAHLKTAGLKPLNQRFGGYDADKAKEVWGKIQEVEEGLETERTFLKLDLAFPLYYGAVLMIALLVVWEHSRTTWSLALLAVPILITMLADWLENSIQLKQIAVFADPSADVSSDQINLASRATQVKLGAFGLSTLLVFITQWLD